MARILSISLSPELTAEVKDRAKQERRSVSEVTREALKRYLSAADKPQKKSASVESSGERK